MSFFGEAAQTQGSFSMGGGDIEPIPNGTQLKACIDEIAWATYMDDTYISARWTVLDGEYKNRKIFQKIRVVDADEKKRLKALQMLAAIDANCGGKLVAAGVEPTDESMALNLMHKPMPIKVMIWEINDKKGNWVQAVGNGSASSPAPAQTTASNIDDEIPF